MANLTSSLTVKLIDDVSKPARTVAQALEDAGKQAKAIAKAMAGSGSTDRFAASLAKLKVGAKDIEAVTRAWKEYSASAKLAANASNWTKAQAAGVRRWESQTIKALRDVGREQAKFARASRIATEAASIAPSAGGSARSNGGGVGRFISHHMISALAAGYSVEKIIGSGAHLQHERVRQAASGMTPSEVMEAAAQSAKIAAMFPSIKLYDVNHMLRNARAIVGSYKEAAEIVEPMAKLRVIAQGARPGADVSEDFDQLVKGLEIKGVTQNPAKFREYMEGIAKGLNVFGYTLKPYQYYEMFKYGRQATPGLSSNFILGTAPTLAQELGGSSYGNAVSGFNRSVVGGRMEHSALKEMYRLGLASKGDLDFLKNGEVKGLKPGHALKGWEVAQADPNQWVKEFFLPALLKAGITSQSAIQKEVSTVFSNKVAAQMVSILSTQQGRIGKDLALLRGAPGLSAADNYQRNDPTIAMASLKNSIEGLNATMTAGLTKSLAPVMSDVAAAIASYTARLTELQQYRDKHPGEDTLGQKRLNRVYNSLVNGVESDKAQSEFTPGERNEIEYRRQRANLLRMRAEEDPNAPQPSEDLSSHYPRWARSSLTAYDEMQRHPYRQYATARLAEIDKARAARLAAQHRLDDFHRDLPRDMSRTSGQTGDHIEVGDGTFGMPTLGKGGGWRGASFGYGGGGGIAAGPYGNLSGVRAQIDETKAALEGLNTTVSPNIDASGLNLVSEKLGQVLGQLNALRAGVDVPITMSVKGSVPNLGTLNRSSFTPSGDPGR